jgi:hypothetical protein
VAAFWALALSTVYQFPRDAGVGVLILLAGVPVYLFWRRREGGRAKALTVAHADGRGKKDRPHRDDR